MKATRRFASRRTTARRDWSALKGSAQVTTEGNVVHPRQLRRDLCSTRRVDRGHAGRRRLRYRRDVLAGRQAASGAVRRVQRRAEGSRASLRRGRSRLSARAEHSHRQERRGGPADGRRHVQRAGQLDVVAAARARGARRRGVSLHRHAGAGVRHPARLHEQDRSRSGDHRARRRRRADAGRLPPERRGARRADQFSLDDGRQSRRRRPPVWRRQRSAGVCRRWLGPDKGKK